jgi:hypothetical protein
MESSDEGSPPLSPQAERPVLPPSPRPRTPEHELRDRTKAAKLRHKAARARMKSNRLEDRARHLSQKAAKMERRADELDGISRPPTHSALNE